MPVSYRVLVVEDGPEIRDLLDLTLRGAGHHVDSVSNGQDALTLLTAHSYDVVLSDLRMPGMSGEDLYRLIEHAWPHLASRVAFVTGSHPSLGFQAQYRQRPVPVISKPFTYERLLAVVEEVTASERFAAPPTPQAQLE